MNALLQIYLCTQLFEAIVKSTKGRFQTTKTMFKSWDLRAAWKDFHLNVLKTGRTLFMRCQAAPE